MRALTLSLLLVLLPSAAFAQGSATPSGPEDGPPLPPDEKPTPQLENKAPTLTNPPSTSAQASDGQAPDGSPPGVVKLQPDSLMDTTMSRSWSEGRTRAFVATTLDIGWLYLRPRASFGYGKPFGTWFGVDVNPIISGAGAGAYAGIRLALPRVDIRVGPRFFYSFDRYFLNPKDTYNRVDLDSTNGATNPLDPQSGKSKVITFETEIEGSIPLGPGDIVALGSLSYLSLLGAKDGQLVFEETLHMIVKPPLVWRARLGYLYRFGSFRQHSIGLVGDGLDVPDREDSKTFRLGPIVRIVLSRRVEIRGSFVPTIYSTDHLGLLGGDFTELGFRYRWATE